MVDHSKLLLLLSCFSYVTVQPSLFLPVAAPFFRKQDLVEMYMHNFSVSHMKEFFNSRLAKSWFRDL